MVQSSATKISPGSQSDLSWTITALGLDTAPNLGYTNLLAPTLRDGLPGIIYYQAGYAGGTLTVDLSSPDLLGQTYKVKVKGNLSGKILGESQEKAAGHAGTVATAQWDPAAVPGGEAIVPTLEQTAGTPTAVAGGDFATSWANQPFYPVNAVADWQQQQLGDQLQLDIILQLPDVPTAWLFCCTETPIEKTTKRGGIIVPHGPRYYLACDPTIYEPVSGDGISWSFLLPLCSCQHGQEQKAAVGRLGVPPEIVWHSQLHLLPPCPTGGSISASGMLWVIPLDFWTAPQPFASCTATGLLFCATNGISLPGGGWIQINATGTVEPDAPPEASMQIGLCYQIGSSLTLLFPGSSAGPGGQMTLNTPWLRVTAEQANLAVCCRGTNSGAYGAGSGSLTGQATSSSS
jgi:hypothetical protein